MVFSGREEGKRHRNESNIEEGRVAHGGIGLGEGFERVFYETEKEWSSRDRGWLISQWRGRVKVGRHGWW